VPQRELPTIIYASILQNIPCAAPAVPPLVAHMKGGFTLAKLAEALRGIPRDARMLIRLPILAAVASR
jgi:hypothetical protein